MGKPSALSFKPLFEAAYVDYHHHKESRLDPISLVHPYSQKNDQEVVAFLVALISYGNVRTIIQS
ncbi:MAG: DUF2400 family protein, partial [Deltaproteobacteria bacterium]